MQKVVVPANAGTHSHRRSFCASRRPPCLIDKSRGMGPGSGPGRLEKWIAFALPLPLPEQRANASILETRLAEGPNLDSLRLRRPRPRDRRCSRLGRGGAMPVHPGKAGTGGVLSASGHCARREAKARARCGYKGVGIAAANATGRRRGLPEPARHLPGMLSGFRPRRISRFTMRRCRRATPRTYPEFRS